MTPNTNGANHRGEELLRGMASEEKLLGALRTVCAKGSNHTMHPRTSIVHRLELAQGIKNRKESGLFLADLSELNTHLRCLHSIPFLAVCVAGQFAPSPLFHCADDH
jgi:hypothetical protein